MLSNKLLDALNAQLKFELDSGHLYLAMAAYFAYEGLDGFSHFFIVQEEEERFHAMKFFHFINEMDGSVDIKGLENPVMSYGSVLGVFEKALKHEKLVTKRIYDLMDLAIEEKEHKTINFLKWFIDEQLEEENMFKDLIKRLQFNKDDSRALYMMDTELAQRVFTPPTAE